MADLRAAVTGAMEDKAEFAERKKAEREALFEQRDNSVVRITTYSTAYLDYLDLQSANPSIRPGNLALVLAQKPSASTVSTMDRWNNRGRNVNRGEHGIKIILSQKYRDDKGIVRARDSVGYVFDVSQTYGTRLPSPTSLADGTPEMGKALRALVSASPASVQPVDGFADGSLYNPLERSILVAADLPDRVQFAALVKEITHAQLHWGYQSGYSREQCATDAESVAYLVCKHFSVEAPPPAAGNLGALYEGQSPDERRAALEYLQGLSKHLMDRVEQELYPSHERAAKKQEEHTK